MYMILRYGTGRIVDSILLSATRERMRVAVRRQPDIREFRLLDDKWTSEDGIAVEIESLIVCDPNAVSSFDHAQPRVATAAS